MLGRNLYKSYLKDTSGNFAMMFGIMSVPILIAVGMAIDIGRLQAFDSKLQDAVDAAAIYGTVIPDGLGADGGNGGGGGNGDDGGGEEGGVSEGGGGDDEGGPLSFSDKVRLNFDANLNIPGVDVTYFSAVPSEDGSVAVSARASIPAMFPQIGGFPRMHVGVGTDADADAGEDVELVIAFDTTNSMGFGTTWTTALGTLNNVLTELDQYSGTENFFVSLVPFSDRVQIGAGNAGWLDGSAPSGWNGCVEPREEVDGSYNWALDDDAPVGTDKFIPSVVGSTGGLAARGGGYPYCANVPITGPTSNVSEVIAAADNFAKSGTGRFDVGLAWVWRLMSPQWRPHWGSGDFNAAGSNDRRQIAIFVTDGRTNAYDYELSANNSWGWNNGSVDGFENMEYICDRMRAQEIEVFMVRVDGNVHATEYMERCASTSQHYYEISSNADLELALEEVVKVVKSNVRLTE